MKIVVIGASGYLGSEVYHWAKASGHQVIGTYHTRPASGLVKFALGNKGTWKVITENKPKIVVWAANRDSKHTDKLIARLIEGLDGAKFVYISSDIVLCPRALAATSPLGDYARRKRTEQAAVLANPKNVIFTVGPIYGRNSDGKLDKRTQPLLDKPDKPQRYWDNVYKTFVPIKGLARTVFANLDKCGQYFIGPPKRTSYFSFYTSRAQAHGLTTHNLQPIHVTDMELAAFDQCQDLSYAGESKRLWEVG